jgi:beta-D-xylosidase 4
MRAAALSLLLLGAAEANILWENVCTQSDVKGSKWCDITAEIDVRAEAFVKTLQLEEKAGIMINNGKGVERLHLPPYQWGSEGLHGPLQPCVNASDGTTKCPTSFPAPCAMASAFNDTMYHYVGAADGREARAINNLRNHATQNVYGDGIDYWSPTVNISGPRFRNLVLSCESL